MGNLFKDLTAGFSSFVLSWLVPSAVVVSLFALFVYPAIVNAQSADARWSAPLRGFVASGAVAATAIFALAVVVLALVTSLGSRPLYRLLEGYSLPNALARPLLLRQHRRYRRLQAQVSRQRRTTPASRGLAREELANYPTDRSLLLPTRLGNALKALETYGSDRYGLDSQTFWYEIYACAPERCRSDADSARASVDFFISLLGLLALLSLTAATTAFATGSSQCWGVAVFAAAGTRPAYSAATVNMTDWRYAVQALLNLSRPELAANLGYRLPETLLSEREFWSAWTGFVGRRRRVPLTRFDDRRKTYGEAAPGT